MIHKADLINAGCSRYAHELNKGKLGVGVNLQHPMLYHFHKKIII